MAGALVTGSPIAVIDIGSNSVRLVVYEHLSRSPTPIFNEKASCGLGREVATTKRLNPDAVDLGSGKRVLTKGGKLDQRYLITVPEEFHAAT